MLRNEVKRELRTAEAKNWNEKVQEATKGSANFWKYHKNNYKNEREEGKSYLALKE